MSDEDRNQYRQLERMLGYSVLRAALTDDQMRTLGLSDKARYQRNVELKRYGLNPRDPKNLALTQLRVLQLLTEWLDDDFEA